MVANDSVDLLFGLQDLVSVTVYFEYGVGIFGRHVGYCYMVVVLELVDSGLLGSDDSSCGCTWDYYSFGEGSLLCGSFSVGGGGSGVWGSVFLVLSGFFGSGLVFRDGELGHVCVFDVVDDGSCYYSCCRAFGIDVDVVLVNFSIHQFI